MDKNQTSPMLKLTRAMFFLNALTWLIFGVLSMFLAVEVGTPTRWVITLLMVANAGGMFWFGLMIASGRIRIFFSPSYMLLLTLSFRSPISLG